MEELGDPLTRLLVKLHLRRRRPEAGEGEARGDARERPSAERWTALGALELGLRLATAPLAYFGERALLLLRAAASVFDRPFRVGLILRQMLSVGVESLRIVMLVGLFSGAVAAESSISALSLFRQEAVVGGHVGVSLARELSPVFAALMLSPRAGSGMAAELGSMRLTEQIEALVSFGVNPVQYLALPRIVAGAIM